MAVRPSPDRSDLESKTREDLQTIAKAARALGMRLKVEMVDAA